MRFTVVLSGLFAVLAAAASESGSATSAAPATAASLDPAQQSQYNCLHACKTGDVDCQAHCIAVPSPNQSQVNATNACVAKCPQGNGSAAQTNIYAQCVQGCIQQHYFVTSEGTPSQTGGSGDHAASNTGTDTAAAPTGSGSSTDSGSSGSASGSATGTKSGSATGTKTGAAATSSTHNAAPAIIASGGAIVGVLAALLAL